MQFVFYVTAFRMNDMKRGIGVVHVEYLGTSMFIKSRKQEDL